MTAQIQEQIAYETPLALIEQIQAFRDQQLDTEPVARSIQIVSVSRLEAACGLLQIEDEQDAQYALGIVAPELLETVPEVLKSLPTNPVRLEGSDYFKFMNLMLKRMSEGYFNPDHIISFIQLSQAEPFVTRYSESKSLSPDMMITSAMKGLCATRQREVGLFPEFHERFIDTLSDIDTDKHGSAAHPRFWLDIRAGLQFARHLNNSSEFTNKAEMIANRWQSMGIGPKWVALLSNRVVMRYLVQEGIKYEDRFELGNYLVGLANEERTGVAFPWDQKGLPYDVSVALNYAWMNRRVG